MSIRTQKDVPYQSLRPHWPETFLKRRKFDRNTENQPYIEYIEIKQYNGEEDEENDDEGEEADDNDVALNEDEDVASSELEDEVEETQQEKVVDGLSTNTSIQSSIARRFMKGLTGDEDFLQGYDIVDEVANFCEAGSGNSQHRKYVALLDERSDSSPVFNKKGHCRTRLEPLGLKKFWGKLSKKRFRVESEHTPSINVFDEYSDEDSDVERRIVFIPDIDPSVIEAILSTAPLTEAPSLRDMFYKHLTRKISIGVYIPLGRFAVFTLDFHIPFYVLKRSKKLLIDPRRNSDGKPLRKSLELDFLSRPIDASKDSRTTAGHYCLYEAQMSIVVTGIDHWVWTAYGLVDTYFGSKESVENYHKLDGRFLGRADPLAAGWIDSDLPIWSPREYFLTVVLFRTREVVKEWVEIVRAVTEEVEGKCDGGLTYNDRGMTDQMLDLCIQRDSQIEDFLTPLIARLSDTIEEWGEFRGTEIDYFLYDGERSTASSSLKMSLIAINKEFSKLRTSRRRLEELKKALSDGVAKGKSTLQDRQTTAAASRLSHLAIITVVSCPPALAASLFSATGILPFTPSPIKFVLVLLLIGALILAIFVIISNGSNWLQKVYEYGEHAIRQNKQQKSENQSSCDPDLVTDLPQQWDIEKGTENIGAG